LLVATIGVSGARAEDDRSLHAPAAPSGLTGTAEAAVSCNP